MYSIYINIPLDIYTYIDQIKGALFSMIEWDYSCPIHLIFTISISRQSDLNNALNNLSM